MIPLLLVALLSLARADDLSEPNASSVNRILGANPVTGQPTYFLDLASDGSAACRVISSALPTGAATAARQDTGNASLASIVSSLPPGVAGVQAYADLTASGVPSDGDTFTVTAGSHVEVITFRTSPSQPNDVLIGPSAPADTVTLLGVRFTTAELVATLQSPVVIRVTAGSGFPGTSGNTGIRLQETSGVLAVSHDNGSGYATGGVDATYSTLAKASSQTDGTQKTQVVDGSGNVIPSSLISGARGLDTRVRNTGIVVSPLNSTTTPLAALGEFNSGGIGESIIDYPEVTINLAGSPALAPGTLYFEFSPDGTNWDVSVPTVLTGPNALVPLPLRSVLPYFRVRYVNGATPLSALRLTTVYHWQYAGDLTRVLNQVIDENEPVKNVRAFIGGKSPDGPFTNLPASGTVTSLSTSSPLGGGASFNVAGTPIPTVGFVAASVTFISDQASASMGVVFQWFKDSAGLELLKESTFTYDTPGSGIAIQVPIQGPYMRFKYTNGAIAQTYFRLSTKLSTNTPPSDVLAISGTITGNTAAQIVKANVVGQQENGVYANTRLSNSGSLKVAVTDRPSEVRGRTRVVATLEFGTLVASPGTLVHTVTAGKIFYLNSLIVSAVNNANALGRFTISDNTTTVIPFILPEKAAGTAAGTAVASPPLPEPIPFTTSIRVIEQAGDIVGSITFVGYEE